MTSTKVKRKRDLGFSYVIPEKESQEIIKNAFRDGCLIWIEGGSWGNRKKLSNDLLAEMLDKAGIPEAASDKAIRAVQRLLDSDKVDEIKSIINSAHNYVRSNSMRWLNDAIHFIRKEKVNIVDEFLKNCEARVKELSIDFVTDEYEVRKEEFRQKYPKLYRPENYPPAEVLLRKFRLRHGFQMITLPDAEGDFSILSQEQMDQEKKKYNEMMKDLIEDRTAAVRGMFLRMVTHLRDILKGGKKFHSSSVEKPKQFLEDFAQMMGKMGDKPFENLAGEVKDLLSGVYSEDLKDDESYRDTMAKAMDDVVKATSDLPKIRMTRDLNFDW